jgi:hypothetical protein
MSNIPINSDWQVPEKPPLKVHQALAPSAPKATGDWQPPAQPPLKLRRQPSKKKSRAPLLVGATLFAVLLVGGLIWWFMLRGEADSPLAAIIGSGDDTTSNAFADADRTSASAFNANVGGQYAFGGGKVFSRTGSSVHDETGALVYDGSLFWLNADENMLYGITERGEIAGIDAGGNVAVLRGSGLPSRLVLDGDNLYFTENGLLKISKNGGGAELVFDYEPRTFTVREGIIYYIAPDGKLWRSDSNGDSLLLDLLIDDFCLDGEDIYFSLAGSSDLYRLETDGSCTVFDNALQYARAPRYAVYGGHLYYGEPNGRVYRYSLSDGATELLYDKDCAAFYLLPDRVAYVDFLPLATDFAGQEFILVDEREE